MPAAALINKAYFVEKLRRRKIALKNRNMVLGMQALANMVYKKELQREGVLRYRSTLSRHRVFQHNRLFAAVRRIAATSMAYDTILPLPEQTLWAERILPASCAGDLLAAASVFQRHALGTRGSLDSGFNYCAQRISRHRHRTQHQFKT